MGISKHIYNTNIHTWFTCIDVILTLAKGTLRHLYGAVYIYPSVIATACTRCWTASTVAAPRALQHTPPTYWVHAVVFKTLAHIWLYTITIHAVTQTHRNTHLIAWIHTVSIQTLTFVGVYRVFMCTHIRTNRTTCTVISLTMSTISIPESTSVSFCTLSMDTVNKTHRNTFMALCCVVFFFISF